MFSNTKNSKQKGDVGLGFAIAYYTSLGWTVCIPLTDSQDYDLIVDDKVSLRKVQVKTSDSKNLNGNYTVSLRVSGGNRSFNTVKHFDCSSVDLLFVLLGDGRRYSIPTSNMQNNKSTITLGGKLYKRFEI